MNYRYKIVLLASFLAVSTIIHAQVGSPYSQFGFGNNQNKGFEQSKAMGGIGIGLRSNYQLNNLNPASYSSIDSLTIIYAIGVNTGFNKIESSVDKMSRNDTKFGYFAMGFKGNKFWGSSFGLAPVSNYDFSYKYSESNDVNGIMNYYITGSGGFNEVYWGNSFKVSENFSLGINASFVFGATNKVATMVLVDDKIYGDNTKVQKTLNVYDIKFNYGAQYEMDLNKNSKIIFGAVYENKMKMNAKESFLGGTVANSSDSGDDFQGEINYNELVTVAIDTSDIKRDITLPNSFGLGFTYIRNQKLLMGIDVNVQKWSGIQNELYDADYNDSYSFMGGMEYTPDYNSVNHYFSRVHYRFGGHYTLSQLEVRNTRINDYGLSLGFGFPMRNSLTSFNITCEVGRRGTLEQNLLRETYGIISLNISLSDIWFVKYKIR